MSSERRKLVLGASWTLASTLVSLCVATILNPILVFYVGIGGYGIWASAIAFASLLALGGDLGVAGALTKFVAERRGKGQEVGSLPKSALILGLLAGCIAGFALAIISPFMSGYMGYDRFPLLLQLQAAQMPINLGTSALIGVRQGKREFQTIAVFSIIQAVTNLFLALIFLASGFGIPGAMIATMIASGIVFAGLLSLSRAELLNPGESTLSRDFRRLVPFGLKLTGTNALSTVLYEIDVVILSLFVRDPSVIGAYALAVFITRSLWILPGSIGSTTYPTISEYLAASEKRRASRYLSTALAASVATTGSLACGLILLGRPLLGLLFGSASLPAYDFALLLLAGTAILGCLRAVASSLSGAGRPDIGFRISAFGASCVSILAFIATPLWGAIGTAVAVSVTLFLVAVVLLYAINRYVLSQEPGLLSSVRVTMPGVISLAACALAVLVATSFKADIETSLVYLAIWILVSAVLVFVSGGKETWGTFFRMFLPSAANRS